MVKRFKNQLIRRLPTSYELVVVDSLLQLMESSVGSASRHDGVSSQPTSALGNDSTCDGPSIALVFGKFVDLY